MNESNQKNIKLVQKNSWTKQMNTSFSIVWRIEIFQDKGRNFHKNVTRTNMTNPHGWQEK